MESVLVPPCYQIASSYRKLYSYLRIRKAGEAIITSFGRVLSQCFYVLEPLCWCLHKEKKYVSTPLPFMRPAKPSYPHSRGRQSHHIEKCARTPMSYTTKQLKARPCDKEHTLCLALIKCQYQLL